MDGRSALGAGSDRRDGLLHYPDSEPRRFSFRSFDETRAAALRRKVETFGGAMDLFGIGPRPQLLGRRVDDFAQARPVDLGARLEQPELLGAVDLRSTFVPTHVTGELNGPAARAAHDVAIAVNGRIAAVVRTPGGARTSPFSAMVPERTLHEGPNRVQVLAVSPSRGRIGLAPLASTPRPAGAVRLGPR